MYGIHARTQQQQRRRAQSAVVHGAVVQQVCVLRVTVASLCLCVADADHLVHHGSVDQFDDDGDDKLTKEELYRRELMLGGNRMSSSPDFECFSPFLDEEKCVLGLG